MIMDSTGTFSTNSIDLDDTNGIFVSCPNCQKVMPVSIHGFLLKNNKMRVYCFDCNNPFAVTFAAIDIASIKIEGVK